MILLFALLAFSMALTCVPVSACCNKLSISYGMKLTLENEIDGVSTVVRENMEIFWYLIILENIWHGPIGPRLEI